MKFICFSLLLFCCLSIYSQNEKYVDSIKAFQNNYTTEYENVETSPFQENTHLFKGHAFFPIDESFKVKATFTAIDATEVILSTSSARMAEYIKLGVLTFQMNGKTYQLSLFYNDVFREDEEYVNKAFVPFMDLTNGISSYDNGRYCYVVLPKEDGEQVILDFNTSTNPYCAYVHGYSCVVPPEENYIAMEVLAGIKKPK